jgi:hypothetical protein
MTVEPKIAAAIDFGTHASGFAWAVMSRLNDDPLTREVTFRTGHAGTGGGYRKELTAILVDKDGQVVAWGHAARARWAAAADAGNPDQLGYAYAFKMAIRDGDADPSMPTVGRSMSLADRGQVRRAVAGYLREIRKAALADITAAGYAEAEIRWCITIPALWDERERHAVRQAACEAGFPDDDERLLLSAEPEAAALRCRLGLDPGGARFLVADCGGGAVGITAYRASARTAGHACPREGGTLDEIGVAVGGRPGSQFIDHAFRVTVLAQRFGAGAMRRLERANAAGLLQLLRDWEQAKATAGVEGGRDGTVRFAAPVVIAIPPAVWEDLDEAARGRLTRQANGEPRRLVLDPELVKALFDTVTTGIGAGTG